MRAIFGVVGILGVCGVIVWWLSAPGGGLDHTSATLKAGKEARQEMSQLGGRDPETGAVASTSIEAEPLSSGGKLTGIQVTKVEPEGAYARYFGLKDRDTIVAVVYQGARQDVRDINDSDMVMAQISEAFQRKGSLIIRRDNKELTLPQAATTPAGGNDNLNKQLDAIPGIAR